MICTRLEGGSRGSQEAGSPTSFLSRIILGGLTSSKALCYKRCLPSSPPCILGSPRALHETVLILRNYEKGGSLGETWLPSYCSVLEP